MTAVEQWAEFVARNMAGRRQVEVSALSGVSQSTLSRWLKGTGGTPTMEMAVGFARACGVNPIEALLVLDVLRLEDLQDKDLRLTASPREFTDAELMAELRRRLKDTVS